jgi:hypothetical protein
MKPIFPLLFLLLIHLPAYNQQTNPRAVRAEYLEKRLNQKRAAWILFGGGMVMTVAGFGINYSQPMIGSSSDNDKGIGLFIVGAVCTVVSIPLFFAAHKNKKRAAAILVRHQPLLYQEGSPGFVAKAQPALTLKIGF